MALECKTIQLHRYNFLQRPARAMHPSDAELMGSQAVHERAHQVVCGEVEDEPERDGDRKGGQSFLEHGEQQEGQTQALWDAKVKGEGSS